MSEVMAGIEEVLSRLKELESKSTPGPWRVEGDRVAGVCACDSERAEEDAELIALSRNELVRLLEFSEKAKVAAERAHELLTNAFSRPEDGGHGVRILSEDAVKLQWALRSIGVGDDSGEPCFTV